MPRRGGGGKIPEVVEGTVKKLIKKADVKAPHGSTHGGAGNPGAPGAPSPHPDVSSKLAQKQNRHLRDDPKYGGLGYMKSRQDAQSVLDAVHRGDATVMGRTKDGHLLVRYDDVTGYNNNPGAGYHDQPTNVFIIKGTAHPSVVPTSPEAKPRS